MALVAIFCACAMPAGGGAQQAAPAASKPGRQVERPDVKVGDLWKYRITDTFTRLAREVSIEVTSVTQDRIHTRSSLSANTATTDTWDREWNQLAEGAVVYTPFYPWFRFPLQEGGQWSGIVQFVTGSGVMRHQVSARVAGWERITVPAGTFDAARIVMRGILSETQTKNYYAANGPVSNVIWYAPAIRRFVRMDISHTDMTPVRSYELAERWELLEHKSN
jgi:hypothetical protein